MKEITDDLINDLANKIEDVTVGCSLDRDDKWNLKFELEEALENDEEYVYFELNYLEKVWINLGDYTVKNASDFDEYTIRKAYAIREFDGHSLEKIINKSGGQYEGQKLIDRYCFYDEMTKEDILNEQFEQADGYSYEELEAEFYDNIHETVWGYIELLP